VLTPWGVIYDETEGLIILANFGLVQEAFENPDLATDREHRRGRCRPGEPSLPAAAEKARL